MAQSLSAKYHKKAGGGAAPAAEAHDASFAPGVSGFVTNQEERTQEMVYRQKRNMEQLRCRTSSHSLKCS